ncbi:hypothetical protein D3C76_1358160 [compost metagenome]
MDPWTVSIELPSIPRCNTSVIVREALILGDNIDYIHAEAIDTLFCPEQHHIIHRSTYLLILPIQIRLGFIVESKIILSRSFVELPGRTPELRLPVVGESAIRRRVFPNIIITVGIVLA